MTKIKNISRYFILAICCFIIFWFSAQNGSESTSKSDKIFEVIKTIFYSDFDSFTPERQYALTMSLTHYIRKTAHFLIYTCLGFLAFNALFKIKKQSLRMLFSVVFCFFYACTDELHQHFVAGRTPLIGDIIIDTCGGLLGALSAMLIFGLIKKHRKNKINNAV